MSNKSGTADAIATTSPMASLEDQDIVPSRFVCPLTLAVMVEPLMTREGHSFEKMAILNWLRKNNTNPLTRCHLEVSQLVPNNALKTEIRAWRQQKQLKYDQQDSEATSSSTDTETELASDPDDDEDDGHDQNVMFVFRLSEDEMARLTETRRHPETTTTTRTATPFQVESASSTRLSSNHNVSNNNSSSSHAATGTRRWRRTAELMFRNRRHGREAVAEN